MALYQLALQNTGQSEHLHLGVLSWHGPALSLAQLMDQHVQGNNPAS